MPHSRSGCNIPIMPAPCYHRHHAGNFADVHKHWLLGLLLEQLLAETAPLHYLESHAGAGLYRNNKTSTSSGIARLWSQAISTPGLKRNMEGVREHNPDGTLNGYPGSPLIAASHLRRGDSAILVEQDEKVFAQLKLDLARPPASVSPGGWTQACHLAATQG